MFNEELFLKRALFDNQDKNDVVSKLIYPLITEYGFGIMPKSVNTFREHNILTLSPKTSEDSGKREGIISITEKNAIQVRIDVLDYSQGLEKVIALVIDPKKRILSFQMLNSENNKYVSFSEGYGKIRSKNITVEMYEEKSLRFARSINPDFIEAIDDPDNAIEPDEVIECSIDDIFEKVFSTEKKKTK